MHLVKTIKELRALCESLLKPLGIVPTMGYLHEGQLSLAKRARADCASVGASIFVNPEQFGPKEDFGNYPRDLERDLGLLEPLGVDVVWNPPTEEVYPPDFQTYVSVEEASKPLEGQARPGHFRGVATVVAKLFNAFTPQRAYFGQKDAQQVVVIQQMAKDLNFPLEIIVCPTIREADGLAMSSRNFYLNGEERQAATVLYKALLATREAYEGGERGAHILRTKMSLTIAGESLANEAYVSVAHPDNLAELEEVEDNAVLSMAVRIGSTRLIDNFMLRKGEWTIGEFVKAEEG